MTVKSVQITSRELAQDIIDKYDNFLFDCDGVIWLDTKVIPGVLEAIEYLESKKKRIIYVTNNSSQSREDYVKKFKKLGFNGVTKDKIYPASYAAAIYLKEIIKLEEGSKVWVLGDSGIGNELKETGYIPVGGNDERLDTPYSPDHELLKVDKEVKAVVVGSTKQFNYMRIALTLQYLLHNNKGLPFIGTNIDRSYPGPNGVILPAGGSVVNFMSYTLHRDFINVGKPSPVLMDMIIEQNNFDRARTLMVGDTMYTDIKFGNDAGLGNGLGSLLVLSGGTKLLELEELLASKETDELTDSLVPLYYTESLGFLVSLVN